jgi:hypothetical protein
VAAAIIRHLLEDPQTLQIAMEVEIRLSPPSTPINQNLVLYSVQIEDGREHYVQMEDSDVRKRK